ncbi:MAG TPA: C45 family peptidase [Gaiellales bacterium]|nr:C45 family peptidase [Gaiellales bacterium]
MAVAPDAIVDVSGSGRERGRAHGEQQRDRIAGALERWDADVGERLGITAAEHVAGLLEATRFLPAVEQHTPDLLEEVRGIAEGGGISFERILAYNLMDEEWWYSQAPGRRHACSLVAVAGGEGRGALLAQNMDLPEVMDGGQTILRSTAPDGSRSVVLTAAGLIGLTGCNSDGVGACVNTLSMLNHSPEGLPVAFVLRGLLERRTLAGAEAFLRAVPHASGQHYAIGAGEDVASFECSAGGVAASDGGARRLWHTNHPLASRDLDPADGEPGGTADSRARLARLAESGAEIGSAADCEELLADSRAPLCVAPESGHGWLTFGSIAMELSRPPAVRIAPGPPDRTPWVDASPA